MSGRIGEAEVYAIFRESPVLAESTKFILESDGVSETEIAKALHKKQPSIHRVLLRLRNLSLVTVRSEGKRRIYRLAPKNRSKIELVLAKSYYPTRSFVLGELKGITAPPEVVVKTNQRVKGKCFTHTIDLSYGVLLDSGETCNVAVWVPNNLNEGDMLAFLGRIIDLQTAPEEKNETGWVVNQFAGYLIVLIEDGTTRKSFSDLDRLMRAHEDKLYPKPRLILIERRDPMHCIAEAREFVSEVRPD
jgi:DNA-binding transcriptional ArsR family regulator